MALFSIRLATPAHEMAQEEILKQVSYLSKDIRNPRFSGIVVELWVRDARRANAPCSSCFSTI